VGSHLYIGTSCRQIESPKIDYTDIKVGDMYIKHNDDDYSITNLFISSKYVTVILLFWISLDLNIIISKAATFGRTNECVDHTDAVWDRNTV